MRSGPGEARTILLLHIISVRPSKQPLMVRTFLKVYMELGSYFLFLQEQIKDIIIERKENSLYAPLKKLRCHKGLKSAGGWGKMPSKLESSGPPDEDSRITQVAGPTELTVCEGVVITRIHPTPKSFRVNTGDVGALQTRSQGQTLGELRISR
jgi:hypothetical protein